jgi:LPPG:FO 2-phospho-L-lactate transferase
VALESPRHVLALAGGVGGAKLVRGLARVLSPEQLTVVVNTGDDFEHLGLSVCPDLDSVMYALAGLNDTERGWGLTHESWQFMDMLRRYDAPDWFSLGDRDLATHVLRSQRLREGESLSGVTAELFGSLGIRHRVAPMADTPVRTIVHTNEGPLAFQNYFVERQCAPRIDHFVFEGAETALASSALATTLARDDLDAIIICPSNPFISIDPMLAIPGVRDSLVAQAAPVVAVSPIVGGKAIKGPAAKMLSELGHDVSAAGIAKHYGELINGIVLDSEDAGLTDQFGSVAVSVTNTMMNDDDTRESVAKAALVLAASLR